MKYFLIILLLFSNCVVAQNYHYGLEKKEKPAYVDALPLSNAGTDITLTLPDNTTILSGTGSDPDGGTVTYQWAQVSGPNTALLSGVYSSDLTVDSLVEGTYVFSLGVTDEEGNMISDEVSVSVEAAFVGMPPLSNAGTDITLTLPDNTTILSGTGSDPEGGTVTYQWAQVSGPNTALLSGVYSSDLTVDSLVEGTYVFSLGVTDEEGNMISDEVSVSVEAAFVDALPLSNAGADITLTLPENTTIISGTGSDPDGGTVTFQWAQVSGPNTALISGADSSSLTIDSLAEGTYVLSLGVTDEEGNTVFDEISVLVAAFVDTLPLSDAGADITLTLPENTTILSGTGSDPDGGTVTFQWAQVSGPNTALLSGADSSSLTIDSLAEGTYVLSLGVTDEEGNTVFDEISVSVVFVDTLPLSDAGADITLTLPENTTILSGTGSDPDGGTVTFQWAQVSGPNTALISGADSSSLTIDSLAEGIFVFSLGVTDEEGNFISDEVSVNVNDTVTEVAGGYTYLFTDQAKNTLKERFETNYSTGPGFTSDFERIKDGLPEFLSDPGMYRPEFGVAENVSEHGELIHMVGLYAYAMDDVVVANVVAVELLETVNMNDLNDPFWNQDHNFSNEYSLFVQTAKVKKLKDTYYLIKGIQDVLTENNKNSIENWFKSYKDLVRNWFVPYIETYIGSNWENDGISTAYPEGIFPSEFGDPFPVKDNNGNPITDYGVSWFQSLFNNRMMDNVSYLHSWAVYSEDMELEHYTREYFKLVLKYGTWSDGTFWELLRNTPSDNTLGVFYGNVTLTSLIYMAHLDAQANHYPNDKLYDFKTTVGIVKGSTNFTVNPYPGGSTTDGVTEKSIKTLILGQSKYLRSSANGGWNDLRYNNGAPMTTVNKRQNSVIAAIANIYYKDQDLKDYYLYATSAGYPSKVTIYEGWGKIEDYGAWGNLIIGGAWMEQESNFFN